MRPLFFFILPILFQASAMAQAPESLPTRSSEINQPTTAEEEDPELQEAYWELGLGFGYVRFEQYPAAGKYSHLFLPFPTFQYRGRTLRADDREGAKAYLWKRGAWTLEISGTGSPPLDSDDNKNRDGMEDLPFILAVGPELVYKFNPDFDWALGAFKAVAFEPDRLEISGAFFQSKFTYVVEKELSNHIRSFTKYYLTFKSATSEIQNRYFGVEREDVTADRPAFRAKSGLLSSEVSVFQSFKSGRVSFYIGGNYSYYGFSENRKSPLHKADDQTNFFLGMTYVLTESKKRAATESEKSGIINRIEEKLK